MMFTPQHREILIDKVAVWRRNAMTVRPEYRDYERRCADALETLLTEYDELRMRA